MNSGESEFNDLLHQKIFFSFRMSYTPTYTHLHIHTYIYMCYVYMLSYAQFFVTPWIAAHQTLTMGFPRQEYWSELPFLSSGDLPKPKIKPVPPTLAGGFFTTAPLYKYFSVTHCDTRFINSQ